MAEPKTCFNTNDESLRFAEVATGDLIYFSKRSSIKEKINEDALGIISLDKSVDGQLVRDDTTVLVVADGMGGLPGGEKASRAVVECLIEALSDSTLKPRDAILNGIEEANRKIQHLEMGAGTTVSVAEINRHQLRTYHVGDSLILLATAQGKIKYQTQAHSPVSYAQMCGALTEEMAMCHPERNLISNYVGYAGMHIDIGPTIKLAHGDTLMLSSDAIADTLYEQEICDFICKESMPQGIDELIQQAEKNMLKSAADRSCHPDDLTLISFRKNH